MSTIAETQPLLNARNADIDLSGYRPHVYVGIDGIGGIRQVVTAAQAASRLGNTPFAAASAIIPLGLLITGPLSAITAAAWTIPDAHQALKSAQETLRNANMDHLELGTLELHDMRKDAKKAVTSAKLGVANQVLYGAMGVAQTASGIVDMCSPAAAQVLHYSPVLTGTAATTASLATSVALGGIYVVRGTVMLARAAKTYRTVHKFHNKFAGCFERDKPVETALEFMKGVEKRGDSYFERRIDKACLKDLTPADGLEYLKAVDKGIFTEKLKQKISIVIATAMIIGGILAIVAATVFTGGVALAVIALVSAVFFISMEYIFLTYDSPKLMELLRNFLYREPDYLNPDSCRQRFWRDLRLQSGPLL